MFTDAFEHEHFKENRADEEQCGEQMKEKQAGIAHGVWAYLSAKCWCRRCAVRAEEVGSSALMSYR